MLICFLCSVLVVPGLCVHPYGSYKASDVDDMWIVDELPKKLLNARIVLYGYFSDYTSEDDNISLEDMGKRLQQEIKVHFKSQVVVRHRPLSMG